MDHSWARRLANCADVANDTRWVNELLRIVELLDLPQEQNMFRLIGFEMPSTTRQPRASWQMLLEGHY